MDINKPQYNTVYTEATHNAFIGGTLVSNIPSTITYVASESQLPTIANPIPGAFAALYGIGKLWQYDGNTWQEV